MYLQQEVQITTWIIYGVNSSCKSASDTFKEAFHVNLALLRPATQSSTQPSGYGGYLANYSVDGNPLGTSSRTDYYDRQPWWKVHLAYPVWVWQVEIIGNESK